MKTVPILTPVDVLTKDLLERIAFADERSMAWYIRQWIRNGLLEIQKDRPTFFDKHNVDNLTAATLCTTSKPGRPKKAKAT